MKRRNFDKWLATFRSSIATYEYYTDFSKIFRNVGDIRVELNILNSLIGEKDIAVKFSALVKKYPEILKCIPIMLAVREKEIYCQDLEEGYWYKFDIGDLQKKEVCLPRYVYFMQKTGLFSLMQSHRINNLVDYVTGVETGLDSNARKNRGGHLMEDLVENYIKKAGFERDKTYFKEMYIHEIKEKWGMNLSAISNNGKTEKRFDYVLKVNDAIYGMETNFYASSGSKLNETSRSYKTLALEAATISGFEFIWITDGKGWKSAKNNLEETFDVMEYML